MIEIKGGSNRYLSELKEFKNGLPDGIINKTKPDVGGTYIAANCNKNYIIVCPFRDLVDSIAADKNNKYNVFKCYKGVYKNDFDKYCNENEVKKIAVTYDSFKNKILPWLDGDTDNWYVVIDEYHLILSELDYREDAILGMLDMLKQFKHYSLLSATPIDVNFEIEAFKKLPHYRVIWDNIEPVQVLRFKTPKIINGVSSFISEFLTNGFRFEGIEVEKLFVFFNSVTGIQQILDSLEVNPEDVKISCADRIRNRKLFRDKYEIVPVTAPNKKLNFFTKKGFQGCNMFTNNGLIVVVSDGNRDTSLIDISTTLEQICGRLRDNKEYHNIFRNQIIHFYSTNNHILNDSEFEDLMAIKESEGHQLIEMTKNYTEEQMSLWIQRTNLDKDVVSFVNGKLEFNELKKQSFIYKQHLKKQYKDGFSLVAAYEKNTRFIISNQNYWNKFTVAVKKAITVSYKTLLLDYMETKDKAYLEDYPEFADFIKYLKPTEINSLQFNKEKMLKAVVDKKQVDLALYKLNLSGFISNKELKAKIKAEFERLGITLTAKASLIEESKVYTAEAKVKKINGKNVRGYEISKFNFKL